MESGKHWLGDIMVPYSPEIESPEKLELFERYYQSGFQYISITVGIDTTGFLETFQQITKMRNLIQQHPLMCLVENYVDFEKAFENKLLGILFNFQGSNLLNGDVHLVEAFYQLGLRQMLLVYNVANLAGGGCYDDKDHGLTAFGRKLVSEINRVGMLVDGTHTGEQTSIEIIEQSNMPVIFSHSNCKSVFDHPRNISDDQIKACAQSGGLIGVNGVGNFLGNNDISSENIFKHIDYIAELVGVEHIALGTDFVSNLEPVYKLVDKYPERFGEDVSLPRPWMFLAPEQISSLADYLIKRGYSDEAVNGIFAENYLRIMKKVLC